MDAASLPEIAVCSVSLGSTGDVHQVSLDFVGAVVNTHRAIGGAPDDLVKEIAELGDGTRDDAQEPKLFGPRQRAVLEEDDARMRIASAGQLQEVASAAYTTTTGEPLDARIA